jgi:hypothetical protein
VPSFWKIFTLQRCERKLGRTGRVGPGAGASAADGARRRSPPVDGAPRPTRPAGLRFKRRRGRNISKLERQGARFDTRQGLLRPCDAFHAFTFGFIGFYLARRSQLAEAASATASEPLANARQAAAAGKIAG